MSRGVPLATNPLLAVRLPPYRSRLVLLLIALGFLALAGRAVYLQVWSNDFLQREGESRYGRTIELPASRGKVLDRNGAVLASSLPAKAVWVQPEEFKAATSEQVARLAKMLGITEREIRKVTADDTKTFTYVKRQVDADIAERVAALGIPGVNLRREYKRYYPEGEVLAHVIGFTGVDDTGQEGIELSRQKSLAGQAGSRRVIRDRLGRTIEDVGATLEPRDGDDLSLSIDAKVQYHAFAALKTAVDEHRAKAGAVVVLDVRSGEVLALANLPSYDPNHPGQRTGAQLRNRVMTDTFEPGSTMKPFTTALALELGKVTPQTTINTAPGKLTIGPNTINDTKAYGVLTVEQILQKSSNVGTTKIALTMPPQKMWEMFQAIGFGQAPQLGFPGAVAGRVRPHKNWKTIDQATMSYGHGISVSLIQLARAYLIFARDGDTLPTSIFRTAGDAQPVPVISESSARAVRRMLEMAAGPEGTAPKAQVVGYRVAGKTGTAHKLDGGRYVQKYVASFVGFAPVSDPRIIVAVMIDEPTVGGHYGGQVAAPVFSRIVGDALRTLRVPPDAPMSALVIPAEPVAEPPIEPLAEKP